MLCGCFSRMKRRCGLGNEVATIWRFPPMVPGAEGHPFFLQATDTAAKNEVTVFQPSDPPPPWLTEVNRRGHIPHRHVVLCQKMQVSKLKWTTFDSFRGSGNDVKQATDIEDRRMARATLWLKEMLINQPHSSSRLWSVYQTVCAYNLKAQGKSQVTSEGRFLLCFPSRVYCFLLFLLYTPFLFPGMNLETLTHVSHAYTTSHHHQDYFSIAVPSESNEFMSSKMEQSRRHTALFLGRATLGSVFYVLSILFLKTALCLGIIIPNL